MTDHPFRLTVHYRGSSTSLSFFTRKAAKHHAKAICNNPKVERISLDSPQASNETLYLRA